MFRVDRLIATPSSAAWKVLVDLDAWPQWGPTVSGARLDPPHTELALGATGTVNTSLGLAVPFVVTEFEPDRHWAWKVAGIQATHHWVQSVGRHTRVSIGVPWWAPGYLAVCSIALRRIDAMLNDAA
jgi:Polyketide cyclase / dehydrase and lipid transport